MPVKQVIVMRTDLNMRKGKMVVQGCHASLGAAGQSSAREIIRWHDNGQTKICVGVDSLEALLDLSAKGKMAGIQTYLVIDAGRTEFKEPTVTCLALGPEDSEILDQLTGKLKLL